VGATELNTPLEEAREHVEAAAKEQSLRERVQSRARELAEGVELSVPIPGYEGLLIGYFRKVPFAELKVIGERMDRERIKEGDAELNAACDALLRVNVEVRILSGEGQPIPLRADGEPVGLGVDLAEALNLGVFSDSRAALKAIMGKDGDSGILGLFDEVMAWSRGRTRDVQERLVGESRATRR
jgi:hypothetical protein